MRIHKSGHEIRSVEDWFKYAPPKKGELQWKDKRSAKELAQSWFRDGTPKPPDEFRALLEAKFGTGIIFDEAKPVDAPLVSGQYSSSRTYRFAITSTAHSKTQI